MANRSGPVGPERRYRALALSRDGRRAATELADDCYGTRDIWLVDMATNALTRLTTNPATDWRAVFSPDGQSVAFASDRAGASAVFRIAADGSGQETEVYRNPAGGAFPSTGRAMVGSCRRSLKTASAAAWDYLRRTAARSRRRRRTWRSNPPIPSSGRIGGTAQGSRDLAGGTVASPCAGGDGRSDGARRRRPGPISR